jgi:hypothetical protein
MFRIHPGPAATAILAAGAIVSLAPQGAQAHAISYSYLSIDDFGFGVFPAAGATLQVSSVNNVSNLTVGLNGAFDAGGGNQIGSPFAPPALDPLQVCLPAGCNGIGQNDWSQHAAGTVPTRLSTAGTFSRADALLAAPTNATTPGGDTATAHSQQVSETNLTTAPGVGSSSTRNGLIASFTFQLAGATDGGTFRLSFDAHQMLDVALNQPSGVAQASTGFRITVRDPSAPANTAPLFTWSPNGIFNATDVGGTVGGTEIFEGVAPGSPDPGAFCHFGDNASLTDTQGNIHENEICRVIIESGILPSGIALQLDVESNSDTNASLRLAQVTEPAGPATIGGLLLLASMYLRRRRR